MSQSRSLTLTAPFGRHTSKQILAAPCDRCEPTGPSRELLSHPEGPQGPTAEPAGLLPGAPSTCGLAWRQAAHRGLAPTGQMWPHKRAPAYLLRAWLTARILPGQDETRRAKGWPSGQVLPSAAESQVRYGARVCSSDEHIWQRRGPG